MRPSTFISPQMLQTFPYILKLVWPASKKNRMIADNCWRHLTDWHVRVRCEPSKKDKQKRRYIKSLVLEVPPGRRKPPNWRPELRSKNHKKTGILCVYIEVWTFELALGKGYHLYICMILFWLTWAFRLFNRSCLQPLLLCQASEFLEVQHIGAYNREARQQSWFTVGFSMAFKFSRKGFPKPMQLLPKLRLAEGIVSSNFMAKLKTVCFLLAFQGSVAQRDLEPLQDVHRVLRARGQPSLLHGSFFLYSQKLHACELIGLFWASGKSVFLCEVFCTVLHRLCRLFYRSERYTWKNLL